MNTERPIIRPPPGRPGPPDQPAARGPFWPTGVTALLTTRSSPADGCRSRMPSTAIVPSEGIVAAQLEPGGGRSGLLSRRSRASTTPPVHTHAVPPTAATVLDQWRPLRLAKQSPCRRELGRCRNSSAATAPSSGLPVARGARGCGSLTASPLPGPISPKHQRSGALGVCEAPLTGDRAQALTAQRLSELLARP